MREWEESRNPHDSGFGDLLAPFTEIGNTEARADTLRLSYCWGCEVSVAEGTGGIE